MGCKVFKLFKVGLLIAIVMQFILITGLDAQSSDSFKLEEYTFNNGGDPAEDVVLQSPGHKITIDSLGDRITGPTSVSISYTMDYGFVAWYPAPIEVMSLEFQNKTTLIWSPEPSGGSYTLYSGDVSTLSSGYGSCKETGIGTEQALITENPPSGTCYFYLITAVNSLNEEGTMGYDSSNIERSKPASCPL